MADYQAAAEAALAERPGFSGALLVVERGATRLAHAVGDANRSERLPNTLETRFGTASGTKTFTAVAALQLVAQGRLALDTPLARAGVALPSLDPRITVGHLLTHTSGAPDYFDEATMDDYAALWAERPVYRMRSGADFLPMIDGRPMMFSPGERFHYNNAGFVLLGLAVERAAGEALPSYVERQVFAPAGMASSGYFVTDQLPGRTAVGYIDQPDGSWRSNIFAIPVIGGGDGGAYVTAPDVVSFWRALLGGALLPPALVRAMLTPHAREDDQSWYGYGVWLAPAPGGATKARMVGGDPGVTFVSTCYPDRDLQIVAVGNVSRGAYALALALEQAAEA